MLFDHVKRKNSLSGPFDHLSVLYKDVPDTLRARYHVSSFPRTDGETEAWREVKGGHRGQVRLLASGLFLLSPAPLCLSHKQPLITSSQAKHCQPGPAVCKGYLQRPEQIQGLSRKGRETSVTTGGRQTTQSDAPRTGSDGWKAPHDWSPFVLTKIV